MPDVIVTGAGGFIGRGVCQKLRSDGHEVLALTRDDGDITDAALWARLPPARAVVHLAGSSYVPDSWKAPAQFLEANVVGTQNALDWCRRHGARMVFASAYVYGIPSRLPIKEADSVQPNNPYALSKHMAERCCEFATRNFAVDATVLRIFNVFGPGQRDEFLMPTLIRQLKGKEIHVLDLVPRRDYVYVTDVVEAFSCALKGPSGFHVFNIGSGQSYSVAEIVAAIQDIACTRLPVISAAQQRRQEIPDVQADISLAREVLGWAPAVDLVTGLKSLVKDMNHE